MPFSSEKFHKIKSNNEKQEVTKSSLNQAVVIVKNSYTFQKKIAKLADNIAIIIIYYGITVAILWASGSVGWPDFKMAAPINVR